MTKMQENRTFSHNSRAQIEQVSNFSARLSFNIKANHLPCL